MSGELWLGLEGLHQLTFKGNYSLNITMTDFDNKTYVAVYDQFQVAMMMMMMMIILMMMIQVGPGDDYVLTVRGFNHAKSTLGDSLIIPSGVGSGAWNLNGMKFSTK